MKDNVFFAVFGVAMMIALVAAMIPFFTVDPLFAGVMIGFIAIAGGAVIYVMINEWKMDRERRHNKEG